MARDELRLANGIRDIAIAAGKVITQIYNSDFAVDHKGDQSPVTEADRQAEAVILAALRELAPDIPAIAEEAVSAGQIPDISDGTFWLVDPLDGTREFISRNGEFTVNIALIRDGRPVLGVVHLPATGETYWTAARDVAMRRRQDGTDEQITVRHAPADGLTAMVSRSHNSPETDAFLRDYNIAERLDAGSSLKFCRVAEGAADLYPRLGRTMEWDIAAGHAVLVAAGGSVTLLDGAPMTYGKPGFDNPHFVARGGA
jgi:3'(2'), 5'-bisphosphate nucleotidase